MTDDESTAELLDRLARSVHPSLDLNERVDQGIASGARARRRSAMVRASVAAVLVVAIVAVALVVSGRHGDSTLRSGGSPAGADRVRVTTQPPATSQPVATAVGVGGTLVAQSWIWGTTPFRWSTDGGHRWSPSSIPPVTSAARSNQQLIVAAGHPFVIQSAVNTPTAPPAIWWSADRGHHFQEASGISGGPEVGAVTSIVEVKDRLLAFGTLGALGSERRSMRWESTDGGRSWSRTQPVGVDLIGTVVVGTGDALIANAAPSGAATATPGSDLTLVRSTDLGRTWSAVSLPGAGDEPTFPPTAIEGMVWVTTDNTTWMSGDGGTRWRALGAAPVIRHAADPAPESSNLEVVAASGRRQVAVMRTFFYEDHYLAGLEASHDDGATWSVADLGLRCTGNEATSQVTGVVRVGKLLVAGWNCLGYGDRGGHVLTSTDDGRTWTPQSVPAIAGMRVGAPVVLDNDRVVVFTSKNIERSLDQVVTITMGS